MTKTNINAEEETMVLRTVYLPVALDEELKKLAFQRDVSKGELIRESLRAWVNSPKGQGEVTETGQPA